MNGIHEAPPPDARPTVAYLKWLLAVHADVGVAIVEAVEISHLSIRVSADKVDAVREVLGREWYLGWRIDVAALGYVEPFVKDIHIFA
ncbi:hypothetical protein [Paraburkholderia fungorum]|uniref:hypothetical protein n=1 Tax=Paraburkholderia fungorum TaxID=134537 RepID=UPI003877C81C